MTIELTDWLRTELARRREQELPEEACGLISRGRHGLSLWAAENVAADPEGGFEISAANLLEIVTQIGKQRQDLVGVYHSHPSGSIAPSPFDVENAARWPGLTWVIVGRANCDLCKGYGSVIDPTEIAPEPGMMRRRVTCFHCDGDCDEPAFWVGVLA